MKRIAYIIGIVVIGLSVTVFSCMAQELSDYKYSETKDLVSLVRDASAVIAAKGEAAFPEFKKEGSQWRHGKVYIFVLNTDGDLVVHPDPVLEGKNQIGIKSVNGKPIIKGIIEATASDSNKNEGWYFYQWPEPGTIFSAWKSTFAKRVVASSGKAYVVCSGVYNPKVEDIFLINAVDAAVALIEKKGTAAFDTLRDKTSQFVFLGTYIFVDTPKGVEVVNGGFPDIEGKNILNYKDYDGTYLTREIIDIATKKGSGWVDYLWPKPGEIKPSRKHTYVRKAVYGDSVFAVGAGSYPEDESAAPKADAVDISGQFAILELKDGDLAAGNITRETVDSVFLTNDGGSTEVSFPRDRVAKIRKPTDEELKKIKEGLVEGSRHPVQKL
ncbi:MAG: cache domain-containing protein [Candidatus Omnitrophica bacterium]|nr:cache domain-containing protein [Candidatus Omnitrophota bacterium]